MGKEKIKKNILELSENEDIKPKHLRHDEGSSKRQVHATKCLHKKSEVIS